MKKLFAVLMAFQLITFPVAMAQDAGYEVKSHKDLKNGGYDFYAKQILQIGTSIVGANMLVHCPLTFKVPSLATYMAGSLVQIISEFAGAKSLTESQNKRMDDLKILKEELKREGGQIQKAALEARLQEERDALKYVKSRLMWMSAVTVIYLAASGLAIYEQISGTAAGIAMGASTCAGLAAMYAAPCVWAYAACYAGHYAACTAASPVGTLASQAAFAVPAPVPGTTACAATSLYAPACLANQTSYLAIAYGGCTAGIGLAKSLLMKVAYVAAFDMMMQKTTGGKTSYLKMMIPLATTMVTSLSSMVMAAYNYPIPRAITFGASGVLAGAITTGLMKRKKIHEKNVKDLEDVLANFKLQTNDVNGVDLGGISGAPINPLAGNELTKLNNGKLKNLGTANALRSCASDADGKFEYSQSACANPIKLSRPNFNLDTGVGPLNQVGQMANDLANAISSGDTAKADVLAGQISSQASRIRATNKALQDRLNQMRKASKDKFKEKPVDFDGDIKKQVAAMQNSFNMAAGSQGLPAMSGDAILGEDLNGEAIDSSDIVPTTANIPDMIMPSSDVNLGDIGSEVGTEDGALNNAAMADANAPSLSDSLDQYESNESDISKDTSVSIFKQLSNRYILNYTKIFNRKEATPEVAPAEEKKQ